jgi:hypothetical protein
VPSELPNVDKTIRTAIAGRRMLSFELDGRSRIGEPHDYGVINGVVKLFFYQVGGESSSGRPLGWRWAELEKVSDLRMLERQFAGSRPAPSGRHVEWDQLFASVSNRESEDGD